MIICDICQIENKKYKCPNCKIFYCSVKCFQIHKDSCQKLKQDEELNNTVETQQLDTGPIEKEEPYQFPTKHTVPQDKLALLGKNDNLKRILANPHLRTILTALTKTQNTQHAMSTVMLEPIFVEFAMECLKTVEEEEGGTESENVEMKQFVEQIKQLVDLSER